MKVQASYDPNDIDKTGSSERSVRMTIKVMMMSTRMLVMSNGFKSVSVVLLMMMAQKTMMAFEK